jgi:hypothetical protein
LDLIGRAVDVLEGLSRGSVAPASEGVTASVVSVIEPDVNQLIGALVLQRSLARSPTPTTYRLVVVDRGPQASALLDACAAVGLQAMGASPQHANPFLNKWLIFGAFPDLLEQPHVLLLDWDIVLVGARELPGPVASGIAARPNRSGMYRQLIRELAEPLPRTRSIVLARVRSSINGGVLIGSGASLRRCGLKTIDWFGEVERRSPEAPVWEADQLALSIAAGEVGLSSPGKEWNVTPQPSSEVADKDVCFWHYNDGVEATRLLKRCLDEPGRAHEQLARVAGRWPTAVAVFSELYAEVLGLNPVAAMLDRKR